MGALAYARQRETRLSHPTPAFFQPTHPSTPQAAYYFDNSTTPAPSAFSSSLFTKFYNFAHTTTSREPLSDWTNTDEPTAVGFSARPVYGAMYTPVLVAQAAQLGLGQASNPAVARANEAFRAAHAAREAAAGKA